MSASGRYSKVSRRIHVDEKVCKLTRPQPNGFDCFMYLLTAKESSNVPGLFQAYDVTLARSLHWPVEGFREAFGEAFREGLAEADWEAGLVWIPNAVRHNEPGSPNVILSWGSTLADLPDCPLKSRALEHLKAWAKAKGKAWEKAFGKACPNQEQEQEQEQEQDPPSAAHVRPRIHAHEAEPTEIQPQATAPESRQRPRDQTQAQPSALPPSASDQGQPATHAAPPVPETRPGAFSAPSPRVARAACDLSSVPLNELATVCRENPRNAEFMPVASLDAVQQIHSAWCSAVGRTVRPLGTLTQRNRQLWAILTALESYSLPDILRACSQASKDDWCRGRKPNRDGTPGRPHGIEDMSPTVLRELLDAADSTVTRTSPAVAKLIAEMSQRSAS